MTEPKLDPFTALRGLFDERIAAALDEREARRRGEDGVRALAERAAAFAETLPPSGISLRVSNAKVCGSTRTIIELLVRDQPFLVDTFHLNLRRLGLREMLILHPQIVVERERDGSIVDLGPDAREGLRESYLYAEVPRIDDPERRREIEVDLLSVYGRLRAVVEDHGKMVRALRAHTADLELAAEATDGARPPSRERVEFLNWLAEDNYIFFGYRRYKVERTESDWRVELENEEGLGALRDPHASRFREALVGDAIPELTRTRIGDRRLIFFDKSRNTSVIHREGRLDCITIKLLDADGQIVGFGRFIGMLTYKAIRARGSQIPMLRARREQVLDSVGAEPGSHTYKAAIECFDSLPLEFLFPFEPSDVSRVVRRILQAAESRSFEIAAVPDPLNRSFFLAVIVPRDHYNEGLREDLHTLLVEKYNAIYVDHRSSFIDDHVALIHFFCTCADDVDLEMLEHLQSDVQERGRRWEDRFESALLCQYPETQAYELAAEYGPAFPEEYRHSTSPADALADMESVERIRDGSAQVELRFLSDEKDPKRQRLRIYQRERPYLTDLLPTIDQFGLRVIDGIATELATRSHGSFWVLSFRIESLSGDSPDADARDERERRVLDALRPTLCGHLDSDGLNRLVLGAGLDWTEVDLLRGYLGYAHQLGGAPAYRFVSETLLRHGNATRALMRLFRARFDPDQAGDRDSAQRTCLAELATAREPIATAQEDRVFALYQNLIQNTVRTHFFAPQGDEEPSVVLKLHPEGIDQMPSPRPFAEIYVHSARMSGVHLRGGSVARGGLRWSDRLHDFRTEVLGLMKTQMVKNGLIVPVGSKGGFVLKRDATGNTDRRAQADAQYARFVRALLCVTDNIVGSQVVPPERVVRHDGDDPYLVVAADKGTAHLSDVANAVAEAEGFWLGDAFASGGSAGYDHKTEAITARGAWLCVKRHFLELGVDVEQDAFTAAGIGDMSGDVFGNGLLLARRAKLLAAFNHRHIFLDPDPDPERAWQERKRLFELPRSSWSEYDPAVITKGGGVYERDARAIALSPEARQLLDIEAESVSGEELTRAIVRMPVDLLWNGGIGTYVRASSETDADVGDRANDGVRAVACELRARVVGEGGNLGLTQLARVEYALAGGRINTDAVDNSGGVDLSDHEVNFKILLAGRCADGRMDREERNRLLRECVGAANDAVLVHNAAQSRSLSLDGLRGSGDVERMLLAARFLESHAGLDAAIEFLPSADALRARSGAGYTRPELAILLGYTKMYVKRELAGSTRLDQAALEPVLAGYFPEALRTEFAPEIAAHRLRREITATCLTNRVIDRAGVTLVPELVSALGAQVDDVVLGYHTTDLLLEADALRAAIDAQSCPESARLAACLRVEDAVRAATRTRLGLEDRRELGPAELRRLAERVRTLQRTASAHMSEGDRARVDQRAQRLAAQGIDLDLARHIEELPALVRAFGVLTLPDSTDAELERAVELQLKIGDETGIAWILDQLANLERRDGWDRVAAESVFLDVLGAQRMLTIGLLSSADAEKSLAVFRDTHGAVLAQIRGTIAQIESEGPAGLAALSVLSRRIRLLS